MSLWHPKPNKQFARQTRQFFNFVVSNFEKGSDTPGTTLRKLTEQIEGGMPKTVLPECRTGRRLLSAEEAAKLLALLRQRLASNESALAELARYGNLEILTKLPSKSKNTARKTRNVFASKPSVSIPPRKAPAAAIKTRIKIDGAKLSIPRGVLANIKVDLDGSVTIHVNPPSPQ